MPLVCRYFLVSAASFCRQFTIEHASKPAYVVEADCAAFLRLVSCLRPTRRLITEYPDRCSVLTSPLCLPALTGCAQRGVARGADGPTPAARMKPPDRTPPAPSKWTVITVRMSLHAQWCWSAATEELGTNQRSRVSRPGGVPPNT